MIENHRYRFIFLLLAFLFARISVTGQVSDISSTVTRTASLLDSAFSQISLNNDIPAITLFDKYKESSRGVIPEKELLLQESNFYTAIGAYYFNLYDLNNDVAFFYKSRDALSTALRNDSANFAANYQAGALHYIHAINIIRELDYGADLPEVDDIQEETVALFRAALNFMQNAYRLNPAKTEVQRYMSAISFSLSENGSR